MSNSLQYVDVERPLGNVSSTVGSISMFDPIFTLFQAAPQMTKAVYQDGGVRWRQSLWLSHMEVRFRCVGAESTAVLPADVHNVVRMILWETPDETLITTASPLATIDDPLNTGDVRRIYCDKTFLLESLAFTASDYNSPQMKFWNVNFPIQRRFDLLSNTAAGTSGWFTKAGNIQLSVVSDSAAIPHPQYVFTCRLYFKMLDDQ